MKIKFLFRKAITLVSLAAFCFAYSPVVQANGLPPISLAQMYSYASSGNVRALRAAVQRGLNIDSRDRFGNTGLCHAILQNNCTAYNAFRASGANPRSPCIQNIPVQQYDRFMSRSCTANIDDTPRQAYNKFNEGEFIIAKRTWVIGGILLAGGLVAILSGGGGGGGGAVYFAPYTEPDDSLAKFAGTAIPDLPEATPYKPITYFADNNTTIINQVDGSNPNNFSVSNNSSIKGTEGEQKLIDIIDLNGNILDYAAYLKVGMKARNSSTVINGTAADGATAPMITIGEASIGMAADDSSKATNYGTLKVLAQNGAFGMVAGNHSVATNQSGDISLQFKGINNQDTIIGMYADTYSSIVNFGNIVGNTINTGGSGTGDTTANAGTMIGMEVRTVDEVPYPSSTPLSTATNNSKITLGAQSDSAAIKTSLIGMGGYLDQDFLDGSKLISRASSLYLYNSINGTITLNYTLTGSGSYAPDENTLLKGNGGIVGMRADAKTQAENDGTISLTLSSGVDNAAAGMLSVHGGTITNNKTITVTGGNGNYGMLSVRGQGSNAEIDSLMPILINGETGSIVVTSTNGFGMASFNGGEVTNNGSIRLNNTGTGMRTNNGILTNDEGATITLQNSGSGMVIKSGDPTTDSSSSGGDTSGGDTSGGDDTSGDGTATTADTGETGAPSKQDLSNAQAINKGTITINNADGAQGIFLEDGTATNAGDGIFITNTSRVPTSASYGIKAEKGTVQNNSKIDMNVLVSEDSSTSVDSYGIYSDSANITNGVTGEIIFRTRGTGIATTSGRVINMGKINLQQGGTGISSSNGNVFNTEGASIIINDNNTAASTGIVSQAGEITNEGTITITNGNGSTGVKAGLKVNNYNQINLTGRNVTGIELTGQDASANNGTAIGGETSGTISITSNGQGDSFYGIKAGASAVNANINNYGKISFEGSDDFLSSQQKAYGISILDGTANNLGSITFDGMSGWAMYTTTGTLNNRGSIIMNAGGIGLYANGAGGQLNNYKQIAINVPDNDSQAATYGLYVDGGATATNAAGGEIFINSNASPTMMLAEAFGIYVNQGSATNNGTITIAGSNSTGMAYVGATDTDALTNGENGVISLTGNTNIGMTSSGGKMTNQGTINIGTKSEDGVITSSINSIGMQTTGSKEAFNQGTINIYSSGSVGLQSNAADGEITNNGTIYIDNAASNSYAFLSLAGTAINGKTGTVSNMQSNTDYMRAEGGNLLNQGTLIITNGVNNVNAMHVAKGGTATNYGDATTNTFGTINVGTALSSSDNNNTGMLVDGTIAGEAINEGIINVYSANSYGMRVDNANGTITNNETIRVTGNANSASYAMYGAKGTLNNTGKIEVSSGQGYGMALNGTGTATNTGTIDIDATGSDTSYGMYGSNGAILENDNLIDVSGSVVQGMYVDSGTATNNDDITVNATGSSSSYGMYGNKTATLENTKSIYIKGSAVEGMFVDAGSATNSGTIEVDATGNNSAYGMHGSTGSSLINENLIDVEGASVYGMSSGSLSGGTAENSGTIKVNGSTLAFGMSGIGGTLQNSGKIEVTGTQGNGMDMRGSGTATNSGTIEVDVTGSGTSYGMYGSNGAQLINEGTIKMTGSNVVGMYATGNGSTITNNGNIIINGDSIISTYPGSSSSSAVGSCSDGGCGNFIQVANGATFVNNAKVVSSRAMNFSLMSVDNSGVMMIGRGGSYEAPEISGNVTASSNIVAEGNQTTYVNEDSFIGEDTGIKLDSGSYLFDASLQTNADGNQDVVMTMKSFDSVVDNGSVANFLSSNYALANNMDMYGILKSAPDAKSFTTAVAEQMGVNLVPSFAKQNMDIVKAVNRHMSQTLFSNQNEKEIRAMFDLVYDYRNQNDVDMLSGYKDKAASAYALFDRKYSSNLRLGLGVSFTKYESDYDNGSERDEVIAQILTPLIYTTEGLRAVSMPRLGIGWGEYKRRADGLEYDADTKNYYYGITNEVRKEFDLGAIVLEPTAEFNVLGMYQDSTKEKDGLEVKSANNLSVEGGLGLYARKSFSIKDENDLTLRAGGSWYHEFNNPYQAARARIAGMVGSYQMDSYDAERDRGILTFRMDYKHEGFDFYFEANKFLEESDGYALSAGMGYKF